MAERYRFDGTKNWGREPTVNPTPARFPVFTRVHCDVDIAGLPPAMEWEHISLFTDVIAELRVEVKGSYGNIGKHGIPDELIERIWSLWKAGNSLNNAARQCGVTVQTASKYVRIMRLKEIKGELK